MCLLKDTVFWVHIKQLECQSCVLKDTVFGVHIKQLESVRAATGLAALCTRVELSVP